MKTIKIVEVDGKEMRFTFDNDREFVEAYCNLLRTYYDCLEGDFSCIIDELGYCMVIKLSD